MEKKLTDYVSKVPFHKFSETLSEQLKELKSNPLLQRMDNVRRELLNDPHRPIYHYVNPEGNLNDPNGLCYWKGNWHLFYQAYPPEDPRQHWGHAISQDLIHWEDLPYAIYPSPEECCFSGSTLVEENRVIAIYHGTKAGTMVAISHDPLLLNWEKLTNQAVIKMQEKDRMLAYEQNGYAVFDPCLWKKGEYYYSLSAGVQSTGPANEYVAADFLFKSRDLINWKFLHSFIEDDQFTLVGDDGACPYFWPIGKKHILLFFSHMSGGQYLLGKYDLEKDKFISEKHGLFNFGAALPSGVHAPSACPDGKGGVIVIFNMNPGKATNGWNQIMTLPRKLELNEKNQLKITPAGNIESLRKNPLHLETFFVESNKEKIIPNIFSNNIEIELIIDFQDSSLFEIDLLRNPNKKEYTRVLIYKNMGFNDRFKKTKNYDVGFSKSNHFESILSLDSSFSSIAKDVKLRPPENAPFKFTHENILKIRIFIDRSVLEVFVEDTQSAAIRVYPELIDSKGISLLAHGNRVKIVSFKTWEMSSIY